MVSVRLEGACGLVDRELRYVALVRSDFYLREAQPPSGVRHFALDGKWKYYDLGIRRKAVETPSESTLVSTTSFRERLISARPL